VPPFHSGHEIINSPGGYQYQRAEAVVDHAERAGPDPGKTTLINLLGALDQPTSGKDFSRKGDYRAYPITGATN
jgi:hypothetical protein